MFILPVSRLEVGMRMPTGYQELFLLEARGNKSETAIALLDSLVEFGESSSSVAALSVSDLEFLLLKLRQMVIGDVVQSTGVCGHTSCRAPMNLDFSIGRYLAERCPTIPSGVLCDDDPGWFRFADGGIRFRLPTARDLDRALGSRDAYRSLREACIDGTADYRLGQRIERALARIAPSYSDSLDSACPECGRHSEINFDVQHFVLNELANLASFIYQDVGDLGSRFHWSEKEIIELPISRRIRYALSGRPA